jgi:hypothetical protein
VTSVPGYLSQRRCLTWHMGPRASLAIAAALIIFPIVGLIGDKHWLDTRILVPLDVPVSLSPGHIRTGDFHGLSISTRTRTYRGSTQWMWRTP